jgi:hypothetical protein
MRIRSHSETHIVELDDGSRWQIFPGDLDLTLDWTSETELSVVPIDDEVSSHALIGAGGRVRVIPADESWPRQGSEIHSQGRIAAARRGLGSGTAAP